MTQRVNMTCWSRHRIKLENTIYSTLLNQSGFKSRSSINSLQIAIINLSHLRTLLEIITCSKSDVLKSNIMRCIQYMVQDIQIQQLIRCGATVKEIISLIAICRNCGYQLYMMYEYCGQINICEYLVILALYHVVKSQKQSFWKQFSEYMELVESDEPKAYSRGVLALCYEKKERYNIESIHHSWDTFLHSMGASVDINYRIINYNHFLYKPIIKSVIDINNYKIVKHLYQVDACNSLDYFSNYHNHNTQLMKTVSTIFLGYSKGLFHLIQCSSISLSTLCKVMSFAEYYTVSRIVHPVIYNIFLVMQVKSKEIALQRLAKFLVKQNGKVLLPHFMKIIASYVESPPVFRRSDDIIYNQLHINRASMELVKNNQLKHLSDKRKDEVLSVIQKRIYDIEKSNVKQENNQQCWNAFFDEIFDLM